MALVSATEGDVLEDGEADDEGDIDTLEDGDREAEGDMDTLEDGDREAEGDMDTLEDGDREAEGEFKISSSLIRYKPLLKSFWKENNP